jgi:hypothetical protein
MEIQEIASTNFVLLQDTWTTANCLDLINYLKPSHAIVCKHDTLDQYYLFEAAYLTQLLINASGTIHFYEVLATIVCIAIPTVESDAEAEDAPDQCILLEDGSPVGFFDASIPPDLRTLRSGHGTNGGGTASEVVLPALIVDVPEKIPLGKVVSVLVLFSTESISDTSTELPLTPPPSPGVAIDFVIKAKKGIVIEGNFEGQLVVPDGAETPPLRFKLRGVRPGVGQIRIFAFHNDQPYNPLPPLSILVVDAPDNPATGSQKKGSEYTLQARSSQHAGLSSLMAERRLKGQQGDGNRAIPNESPLIQWQDCRPEQAVLHLVIGQEQVEAETPLQELAVSELRTLLGQLFPGARAVLVEILTPGFSGTKVLKIHPFFDVGGGGRAAVVKFGDIHVIEQEHANYIKHVQDFIGDGRLTAAFNYKQTTHLGGILYSLLGADGQETRQFGEYYQQKEFPDIERVLDNLFRRTCGIWYANPSARLPLNLTEEYQWQGSDAPEQFERSVAEHLPSVRFQSALTFTSFKEPPARSFTNPIRILTVIPELIRSTYVCTVHGDLNQNNIFVDQTDYPWLIDFRSTGPSHMLRDAATLDAVVRFQLLTAQQATLEEFLSLEEVLCSINRFSQLKDLPASYPTTNPAIAKVYQTVLHLRKLAHWLVERNPVVNMSEYYIALFYLSLETLQFFALATEQRERALISASLLVDTLGLNRG